MNYKELLLAVLVIAVAVCNGYFWKNLVFSGSFSDAAVFSLSVVLLLLFAASFSLLAMLGKKMTIGMGSVAAAFIGSFFFVEASAPIFSGLGLTLIGALWAFRGIRIESQSQNIPRLRRTISQGLPLFFTSIAVMISVFYFAKTAENNQTAFLPKAAFEFSLPLLENALQGLIPGFRANAAIDDILKETLERKLGSEVDFSKIPAAEMKKLIAEQRKVFANELGIEINGEEKAGDLVYRLANQKIDNLLGEYRFYLPYLSAFGFFLAMKALTLPFYLISLGFIWILIQLLLAIGIITRETVDVRVERITL